MKWYGPCQEKVKCPLYRRFFFFTVYLYNFGFSLPNEYITISTLLLYVRSSDLFMKFIIFSNKDPQLYTH